MADPEGHLARSQLRVDAYAGVLCVHEGCRFTLITNLVYIGKHLQVKHNLPADLRRNIINLYGTLRRHPYARMGLCTTLTCLFTTDFNASSATSVISKQKR